MINKMMLTGRKRSRAVYKDGYLRSRLTSRVPRSIRSVIPLHTIKRIGQPIILGAGNATNNYTMLGGSAYISIPTATPKVNDNAINSASQFGFALQFSLDGLGASKTDITNLFDNYRIKKVRLMFSYTANQSAVSPGAANTAMALPLMHHCYDPDGSVFPNDENTVLQNERVKSRRLGDGIFYLDVYPRAQQVIGTTGGNNSAVGGLLPSNTWLDAQGASNVNHYGFMAWMRHWPCPTFEGYQSCLTITPKYYIECKNQV